MGCILDRGAVGARNAARGEEQEIELPKPLEPAAFDPDRIVVMGGSAGAHVGTVAAYVTNKRSKKQVVSGGRLIWRSASLNPPYVKVLAAHGFECHCVHRITDKEYNGCIDRVNMYASFWYADRK